MVSWGFSLEKTEINVDEDLPNFFMAIKRTQSDEILEEYKNLKLNYGFEIEDYELLKNLRKCIWPDLAV